MVGSHERGNERLVFIKYSYFIKTMGLWLFGNSVIGGYQCFW